MTNNTYELMNTKPLLYAENPYFELELEASDRAQYPRYAHSRATISMCFFIILQVLQSHINTFMCIAFVTDCFLL